MKKKFMIILSVLILIFTGCGGKDGGGGKNGGRTGTVSGSGK